MTIQVLSTSSQIDMARRTSSDDVFDEMFKQITSLELMPGDKVSEVEIAKQFDVSRQPVREAFIKLANMGLLLIRPQRSTVVRKISLAEVADARFVRLAIEVEAVQRACENFNDKLSALFDKNLAKQKALADKDDGNAFRALDSEFHKLICQASGHANVFDAVYENKLKVDRLCALSMKNNAEYKAIIFDHESIVSAMKSGDKPAAVAAMRRHLSRLDETIERISQAQSEYFEDI